MDIRDERRDVTALFADLVGSTALGERLDPEELKLVVGDAVARMVMAVEAFGGTVKDLAGDGVLALFGAPTAHEDDSERAVRAGLRIVDDIATFGREVAEGWGVDALNVRIGINTGPVITGAIGSTPGSVRTRVPSATPSTVNAVTGSDFPFSSNARSALHANRSATTCCVACPTRTEPGWACDCRRAATFTASPSAVYSYRRSDPTLPTMTGPLLMPARIRKSMPWVAFSWRANSSVASSMSSAARMARSGSSSCATGAPKNASNASPWSWAIVPS